MRGEELESMSVTDGVEFCCKGEQGKGTVTSKGFTEEFLKDRSTKFFSRK